MGWEQFVRTPDPGDIIIRSASLLRAIPIPIRPRLYKSRDFAVKCVIPISTNRCLFAVIVTHPSPHAHACTHARTCACFLCLFRLHSKNIQNTRSRMCTHAYTRTGCILRPLRWATNINKNTTCEKHDACLRFATWRAGGRAGRRVGERRKLRNTTQTLCLMTLQVIVGQLECKRDATQRRRPTRCQCAEPKSHVGLRLENAIGGWHSAAGCAATADNKEARCGARGGLCRMVENNQTQYTQRHTHTTNAKWKMKQKIGKRDSRRYN